MSDSIYKFFTIKLPTEVHRDIKGYCAETGITMKDFAITAFKMALHVESETKKFIEGFGHRPKGYAPKDCNESTPLKTTDSKTVEINHPVCKCNKKYY